MSTELQSNLARVVNIPTSRYTTCQMRSTRDCVLLDQAEDVISRVDKFFQDFLWLEDYRVLDVAKDYIVFWWRDNDIGYNKIGSRIKLFSEYNLYIYISFQS